MAALALAFGLALTAAAGPGDRAAAQAALDAALAVRGARAELVELSPATPRGCAATTAEATRPIAASGEVPLRLAGEDAAGAPCEAWAWARVRVHAPALVTASAVAEGAPLAGATATAEREVLAGHAVLSELPEGAVAERALAAGVALDAAHVRVGPRPGEPVRVLLRAGAIEISQEGRAVACRRGRACALLPSGRRVEGAFSGGRLVVEAP